MPVADRKKLPDPRPLAKAWVLIVKSDGLKPVTVVADTSVHW